MAQFAGGTTYTNTPPGNQVTATNLNALITGASALSGLVTAQPAKTARTSINDTLLGWDSTDGGTLTPKQFPLSTLLPEVVANGSQQYAAGAFGGGTYTITLNPSATGYTAGMTIKFLASSANTGATLVNVNGLGTQALTNAGGGALAAGQIPTSGMVEAVYDGSQFKIVGVQAPTFGTDIYAADTGSANSYIVTLATAPAAYVAGLTIRFKAANTNTGASGINVNVLGSKNIIRGNGGALQPNDILAGAIIELTYDGTNFQLLQNKLGTHDFTTGLQALPGPSATLTVAHGLPSTPTRVRWVLQCVTGNAGFSPGAQVDGTTLPASGEPAAFIVWADATNVYLTRGPGTPQVVNPGSFAWTNITPADWNAIAYVDL